MTAIDEESILNHAVENIFVFIAPKKYKLEDSTDRCKEKCYVVTSEALADVMESRGYKRLKVSHCSDIDLPNQPSPVTADMPFHLRPPPAHLVLPKNGRVPPLIKGEGSIAEKIIIAFEEKVMNEETNTVYSPLRLWTKAARREFHMDDSNFTARCKCYYAIRTIFQDKHPSEIDHNVPELEHKALAATKTKREALAKKQNHFCWYQACVDIYNNTKVGEKEVTDQKPGQVAQDPNRALKKKKGTD